MSLQNAWVGAATRRPAPGLALSGPAPLTPAQAAANAQHDMPALRNLQHNSAASVQTPAAATTSHRLTSAATGSHGSSARHSSATGSGQTLASGGGTLRLPAAATAGRPQSGQSTGGSDLQTLPMLASQNRQGRSLDAHQSTPAGVVGDSVGPGRVQSAHVRTGPTSLAERCTGERTSSQAVRLWSQLEADAAPDAESGPKRRAYRRSLPAARPVAQRPMQTGAGGVAHVGVRQVRNATDLASDVQLPHPHGHGDTALRTSKYASDQPPAAAVQVEVSRAAPQLAPACHLHQRQHPEADVMQPPDTQRLQGPGQTEGAYAPTSAGVAHPLQRLEHSAIDVDIAVDGGVPAPLATESAAQRLGDGDHVMPNAHNTSAARPVELAGETNVQLAEHVPTAHADEPHERPPADDAADDVNPAAEPATLYDMQGQALSDADAAVAISALLEQTAALAARSLTTMRSGRMQGMLQKHRDLVATRQVVQQPVGPSDAFAPGQWAAHGADAIVCSSVAADLRATRSSVSSDEQRTAVLALADTLDTAPPADSVEARAAAAVQDHINNLLGLGHAAALAATAGGAAVQAKDAPHTAVGGKQLLGVCTHCFAPLVLAPLVAV